MIENLNENQKLRLINLATEGKQFLLDSLAMNHLGWEISQNPRGPYAYVDENGWSYNNIGAVRRLIDLGIDVLKYLGIWFTGLPNVSKSRNDKNA